MKEARYIMNRKNVKIENKNQRQKWGNYSVVIDIDENVVREEKVMHFFNI